LTCPLSMQAGGGWAGPGETNKGRTARGAVETSRALFVFPCTEIAM
jgi:hypothetical protein